MIKFPNAEEYEFKPAFIERYSKLTDWNVFSDYCLSFLRRSIRINTLKITIEEVKERLEKKGWILDPVPWCKEAFFITHKEGRRDTGNTIEHQLGYFYIQESVSLVPPIALDPQPSDVVLDMAASPGSKASQISQMMKNEGLLVANDAEGKRLAPLGSNLTRCGVLNCVVTHMRGQQFKRFPEMFDKVLIDAPCSGSGTIRKSPKTIRMWNPNMLRKIATVQKELIQVAFNVLKKGGVMVYSTCSLEPEENEAIVNWLLERNDNAEIVEFELEGLKHKPALVEFEGKKYKEEVKKTLRLWPQDNDTEGFYVAKIRKN